MIKPKKRIIISGLLLGLISSVNAMNVKPEDSYTQINFDEINIERRERMVPSSNPEIIPQIHNINPETHFNTILQPNLCSLRKFYLLGEYEIIPDFWYYGVDGKLFMGIYGKNSINDFYKKISEYTQDGKSSWWQIWKTDTVSKTAAELKKLQSKIKEFLTDAILGNMNETCVIFSDDLKVIQKSIAPCELYANLCRKYDRADSRNPSYAERCKKVENVFAKSIKTLCKEESIKRDSEDFKKALIFSTNRANKSLLTYLQHYECLNDEAKSSVRSLQKKVNSALLCHGAKFCTNAKPLVGVNISRCKIFQDGNDKSEGKTKIVFIPNDVIPKFLESLLQNADKDYSNITGQHRLQITPPEELTRLVSYLNPDAWQNDIDVINEYKNFLQAEKSHHENAAKSSFAKFGFQMAGNVLTLISKVATAPVTGGIQLNLGQSSGEHNNQTFSMNELESAKSEKDAIKELISHDNQKKDLQRQADEINETVMNGSGLRAIVNPSSLESSSDSHTNRELVSNCAKALRESLPKPEDVDEFFAGFDHLVDAEKIEKSIDMCSLRLENARQTKKYEENFVNNIKLLIQLVRAGRINKNEHIGLLIIEDRSGVVQNKEDEMGAASRIKYTVYPVPKLEGFELK